jgi:acyl-CoA synthetase (AMP-forming)/AMP-acid ligase II
MENFREILLGHAATRPDKTAFVMLNDFGAEVDRLTYAGLDCDARSIGSSLSALTAPQDRALVLYSSGLDFIRAFMGCQYAGVVAVPASLPFRYDQHRKRVEHVIEDAGASVIMTEDKWVDEIRGWLRYTPYARLPILATSECLSSDAASWNRRKSDGDVAFIQYTSGSTGQPKGVIVRHSNIIHNSRLIRETMGYSETLLGGGWLPFFHDMGLIGLILQPAFLGASSILMSPTSFIKRPANWLKMISKYRIEASGGPNFGYEHCLSRIHDQDMAGVDLSCWRLCFSGSEPVRADTIERFLDRFGRYGVASNAFYPCYGMAETTLFVAGGKPSERHRTIVVDADKLENDQVIAAGTASTRRQRMVSCGTAPEFDLAIVDPVTQHRLGAGQVGEVWLRGESVAAGYWKKPDLTRDIFGAVLQGEPGLKWLRTGDLGFIDAGELFICGRLKDMIIVAGRNIYPQDIEARVLELHPSLQGRNVAAFGVDAGGSQSVGIICEVSVKELRAERLEALVALIRGTIAAEFGTPVARIVIAAKGSIARTTSGKLQRRETQRLLNSGSITTIWDDLIENKVA